MRADGKRTVVELTFATALPDRDAETAHDITFITPAAALKPLGAAWAIDLQAAIATWGPGCTLVVDASHAPGFGLQILQNGVKHVYCPAQNAAFDDLRHYAAEAGATLVTQRPIATEVWTPIVPTRKTKRTEPPLANRQQPSRKET